MGPESDLGGTEVSSLYPTLLRYPVWRNLAETHPGFPAGTRQPAALGGSPWMWPSAASASVSLVVSLERRLAQVSPSGREGA